MSFRVDDRWLWLGFGVFFVCAAHAIRYAIRDVVGLIRLDSNLDADEDDMKTLPEDNISLEVLKILSESPNPNISNAAISLVVSRFERQPQAYRSVLADTSSDKDEVTRTRARQALKLLRSWPGSLDGPSTFPRSPISDTGSTAPSLPNLEDAIGFATIGGDLWADASASPPSQGISSGFTDPVNGWTSVVRETPTGSERERRQQRREAMVLREADGEVEEDDIIRRSFHSS